MAELQGTCGSAVLCRCIRMTKGRRRGRKQERGRRLSRKADCRVSFISLFLRAGSLSTDQTTVFILCMRDGKVSESLTSNFEPLAVRMMSGSLDKSATQGSASSDVEPTRMVFHPASGLGSIAAEGVRSPLQDDDSGNARVNTSSVTTIATNKIAIRRAASSIFLSRRIRSQIAPRTVAGKRRHKSDRDQKRPNRDFTIEKQGQHGLIFCRPFQALNQLSVLACI